MTTIDSQEVSDGDRTQQLAQEEQLESVVKISRQMMILLEDYRYLMSCYQDTCSCHVHFDHQVFYKKLEDKCNLLVNIANANTYLADALNDSNDFETLHQMLTNTNTSTNFGGGNRKLYIERVKVCNKPRPNSNNTINKVNIKNHNNNENEFGGEDQEMTDLADLNEELKNAKEAYKCTHAKCDYLTFNQEDMVKHYHNHDHGQVENTKRYEKADVLYVCDQCGKEFSGQKWLDNHIENVHQYVKLYKCEHPGCAYRSKFRCVMDDHRKRHGAVKEFKCTWSGCESAFVTKRDMMAHINFYHRSIKNYPCTWENCQACFKDSNRLRHHLFTHTGERPYRCDFTGCVASFKQMPHLHKHRKTHQMETPQRVTRRSSPSFACPVGDCVARFTNEEEMKTHVSQQHSEITQLYMCEDSHCTRYFVGKRECEIHMKDDHPVVADGGEE